MTKPQEMPIMIYISYDQIPPAASGDAHAYIHHSEVIPLLEGALSAICDCDKNGIDGWTALGDKISAFLEQYK